MSPAKSKTPAELATMPDADLKRIAVSCKEAVKQHQRLGAQVNRERNRRRRARKVAPK